jgi:hypothetical protein
VALHARTAHSAAAACRCCSATSGATLGSTVAKCSLRHIIITAAAQFNALPHPTH